MIRYIRTVGRGALKGTALLRLDFNTEDNWRMEAAQPTIRFLLRHAERIVIVSHRGRPAGKDKKFSLRRDAVNLGKLLGKRVVFVPYAPFAKAKKIIFDSPRGSVFVLENMRFWKGEEANDPKFARTLASFANYYVNDAFAVSHRANASVSAITKFLPSYAGLEFEKEIATLSGVLKNPKKPLVFVLAGGKAGDKLGIIKYFRDKARWFLLGGAAANTILKIKGMNVGDSKVDDNKKDIPDLKTIARLKNVMLPVDFRSRGGLIFDAGPKTTRMFGEALRGAKTIIWSGPLGFIEKKQYEAGSLSVARAIAKNQKAFSVAGGGETVMFLKKHGLDKKFSFISTGGGAMIDFLAGKTLPGIEALQGSKK
jgi:3-phosphoglycerate kinase